jgi:hypothetical protein
MDDKRQNVMMPYFVANEQVWGGPNQLIRQSRQEISRGLGKATFDDGEERYITRNMWKAMAVTALGRLVADETPDRCAGYLTT